MKGTGSESWILLIDDAEQRQRYPGLNSIEFQILRMILTFQTLKLSNCHPLDLKYYQNFKVYLLMNKGTSLFSFYNERYGKIKVVLSWFHLVDGCAMCIGIFFSSFSKVFFCKFHFDMKLRKPKVLISVV